MANLFTVRFRCFLGLLTFLSPFFLSGCPELTVCHVEIIPSRIHARKGLSFLIEARYRNCALEVITDPSISVDWIGPAGVKFYPPHGNPTRVVIEDPALYPPPGSRGHDPWFAPWAPVELQTVVGGIKAKVNGVVSQPAYVYVNRPDQNPGRDHILLSYDEPSFPSVVLFDGATDLECLNDHMVAVVGTAYPEPEVTGGCGSEGEELAVFSPTRMAHFDPTPGDQHGFWTAPPGGGILLNLDAPDIVKVVAWHREPLPGYGPLPGTIPESLVKAELSKAQKILNLSRAGVFLESEILKGMLPAAEISGGTPAPSFDVLKCHDLPYIQGKFPFFEPDAETVYVVYVGLLYEGSPSEVIDKGAACPPTVDMVAGLIILNAGGAHISTLAHELGHIVGLNDDVFGDWAGHTNELGGFDRTNIMWPGNDADGPGERDRFSIGQVYRINADMDGWLSRGGRRSNSVCCQCEPHDDRPCPRYNADIALTLSASGSWCINSRTCTSQVPEVQQ